MKTDDKLKRDVEEELRWDPDLGEADIAVSVKNAVVTLTGFARSYGQKLQAEEDAKRVAGVLGLANDIDVRLPVINRRPDPDIARDAVAALHSELPYTADRVQVVVKEGRVTLEGKVEWHYQRERAESALRRIRGLKSITNLIDVMSVASGRSAEDIEREFGDHGYGTFKGAVADAVIACLEPIRERYTRLRADPGELERLLGHGARKAAEASQPTLRAMYDRMGFANRSLD